MNRKCFAVAMATVMTALCFAGCSNAPAEESDTGIKNSDIESSISAESSVTEAESSVVTEKKLKDTHEFYSHSLSELHL